MDLHNISEIHDFINSQYPGIEIDVRYRPSDQMLMIYISKDILSDKAKKNLISQRQLGNLKKSLFERFASYSEIIFIQNDSQLDLEAGFFQILNRKFNSKIISLFISFRDDSTIDIYIEIEQLNDDLKQTIHEHLSILVSEANLIIGNLNWLNSPSDLPPLIVLLRTIKTLQPVRINEFNKNIQAQFSSASDKWINHKLDQLRKNGLIKRQKSTGTYVLTDVALNSIPAGTKRTSSDIERALALGRRKW